MPEESSSMDLPQAFMLLQRLEADSKGGERERRNYLRRTVRHSEGFNYS